MLNLFSLFMEDIIIAFMSKNIFNNTGEKYIIHFMDLPIDLVFSDIRQCLRPETKISVGNQKSTLGSSRIVYRIFSNFFKPLIKLV